MHLENLKNKTILLLGKTRSFSEDEFNSQMIYHNIEVVKQHTLDAMVIVEGAMMTPYEQNESDRLYDELKLPYMSIDALEKMMAKSIDSSTLLMSLKLSKDKGRLKDFLTNSMIDDELFLKLLKIYNWGGEDFFENDHNRDVSAAFIERFYKDIERNHNVAYASTGFLHLAKQTSDTKLLDEIYSLPPIKFHPKIKQTIASNIYCDKAMQKKLYKSDDEIILKALSQNQNLSYEIAKRFLSQKRFASEVAKNITLDNTLFEMFVSYKTELAQNKTLTKEMQRNLLSLKDNDVNLSLASNNHINITIIKELFDLKDEEIEMQLYQNSSTPQEMLVSAYQNPAYHEALSKNENTPIEILYQLLLDRRYERFVKSNPAFGKHIQTENIGWL
ncbi:MAG: hypothetical protein JXQ66_02710 [Campylobacterales bacterium]|nr:hypothetical protein [Campylobacterales bacterium]